MSPNVPLLTVLFGFLLHSPLTAATAASTTAAPTPAPTTTMAPTPAPTTTMAPSPVPPPTLPPWTIPPIPPIPPPSAKCRGVVTERLLRRVRMLVSRGLVASCAATRNLTDAQISCLEGVMPMLKVLRDAICTTRSGRDCAVELRYVLEKCRVVGDGCSARCIKVRQSASSGNFACIRDPAYLVRDGGFCGRCMETYVQQMRQMYRRLWITIASNASEERGYTDQLYDLLSSDAQRSVLCAAEKATSGSGSLNCAERLTGLIDSVLNGRVLPSVANASLAGMWCRSSDSSRCLRRSVNGMAQLVRLSLQKPNRPVAVSESGVSADLYRVASAVCRRRRASSELFQGASRESAPETCATSLASLDPNTTAQLEECRTIIPSSGCTQQCEAALSAAVAHLGCCFKSVWLTAGQVFTQCQSYDNLTSNISACVSPSSVQQSSGTLNISFRAIEAAGAVMELQVALGDDISAASGVDRLSVNVTLKDTTPSTSTLISVTYKASEAIDSSVWSGLEDVDSMPRTYATLLASNLTQPNQGFSVVWAGAAAGKSGLTEGQIGGIILAVIAAFVIVIAIAIVVNSRKQSGDGEQASKLI